MTDWTPQDDWSLVKEGDIVRVENSDNSLAGIVTNVFGSVGNFAAGIEIKVYSLLGTTFIDPRDWSLSVPAKPAVELPTEAGIYVSYNEPPSPVIVHKLTHGDWVDAGDENYLEDDTVIALMPLTRLEPVAVTAKKVIDLFHSGVSITHIGNQFGVTR